VFTTYGREPVTEIIVDVTYIAGADAVRAISPMVGLRDADARCLVATDVFGGGSVSPTVEPTPAPSATASPTPTPTPTATP
jgi:hypothetical protein